MGDICWRGYVVWLRFIPVWLARPRESNFARHHTFQPGSSSRPPILWCISPSGSLWTRFLVPSPLHGSRVPGKDGVHYLLACVILVDLRQTCSSVSAHREVGCVWLTII